MNKPLPSLSIVLALGLLVFSTACSGTSGAKASRADLPSYVYGSAMALEAYTFAVDNQELLEQLPCYCGCGKETTNNHKNLKECFIKPDGSFDPHAAGCDVCDKEVLDVIKWQREGKAVKEIRALVDEKYSEYGDPTDTPPVE